MTPKVTDTSIHHVHVIGIGGKGMSAIAAALLDLGKVVSGSDLELSPQAKRLQDRGVHIHKGHSAAHGRTADMVIYSSAIKPQNPELVESRLRNQPVASRASAIADLFNDRQGIAIAGTHGKTTTAAMVSTILHESGCAPSFLIGADVPSLGNLNGHIGSGQWMVLEADEFDDAFLSYQPEIAVLTHLEPDHLDHFGTIERMVDAFKTFVENMSSDTVLIARRDIPLVRAVAEAHHGKVQWFGPGSDWQIADYETGIPGPSLRIDSPDEILDVTMQVPGHHNTLNALAAIVAATQIGIEPSVATSALEKYCGSERRLQLRTQTPTISVYEDYAHHPTAIRASLQAVRELDPSRVIVVYQPLLQSRTRDLFHEFLDAFQTADLVFLAEISSPPGRETPLGIQSADLANAIAHPSVQALTTFEGIVDQVLDTATSGDLILVMGPESITPLADQLVTKLEQSPVT
ncbi:MAG: UDP-N-acetylmuramate--L-alanine ligase [Chloroflexi bacterium]|nr:UDP-N-acetylmuramate--L-alanine ligase [Chloroflexota bacterium]|tara:strand:+ start:6006 stop:7391 length:1386 start_codon:yes stop_codon:yes gene_type:complete